MRLGVTTSWSWVHFGIEPRPKLREGYSCPETSTVRGNVTPTQGHVGALHAHTDTHVPYISILAYTSSERSGGLAQDNDADGLFWVVRLLLAESLSELPEFSKMSMDYLCK